MSSTLYEGHDSFISQPQPTTDDLITSKRLESQYLSTEETFLNTRYLVLEDPGTLNYDETKKLKGNLGLARFSKSDLLPMIFSSRPPINCLWVSEDGAK